jgi:hypothetical protein
MVTRHAKPVPAFGVPSRRSRIDELRFSTEKIAAKTRGDTGVERVALRFERGKSQFFGRYAHFIGKYPVTGSGLVVRSLDPRYKARRTACSVTAWLLSRH